jgi:hypothetical protein
VCPCCLPGCRAQVGFKRRGVSDWLLSCQPLPLVQSISYELTHNNANCSTVTRKASCRELTRFGTYINSNLHGIASRDARFTQSVLRTELQLFVFNNADSNHSVISNNFPAGNRGYVLLTYEPTTSPGVVRVIPEATRLPCRTETNDDDHKYPAVKSRAAMPALTLIKLKLTRTVCLSFAPTHHSTRIFQPTSHFLTQSTNRQSSLSSINNGSIAFS